MARQREVPKDSFRQKVGSSNELVDVKLTREEEHAKGKRLADVNHGLKELEREMADFKDIMKERVKPLEAEKSALTYQLRKGVEEREVKIERWADFGTNSIDYMREDNGEILRSRPMTLDERQQRLFPLDMQVEDTNPEQQGEA